MTWPNNDTEWNDKNNDDQDTIPRNDELTMTSFIDHENEGISNDLGLTNDQILFENLFETICV